MDEMNRSVLRVEAARDRIKRTHNIKNLSDYELIVHLVNEIDDYRDKIEHKDCRINELILQRDALTPKEPAETFTTEQASDGGCMTINFTNCHGDMIEMLLTNGYYVCGHVDEPNGDTITIEFWRA